MNRYTRLSEIQSDILTNKITLSGLVLHYINNIESKKHLNAFLEVYEKEAKQQAVVIQEKILNGTAGKLAGMVLAIKDNICYKNHAVGASSKILKGFSSIYNATIIERLLKEDVIIIGRTNCDEFAMGASNENSAYGTVLNEADNTCVSGGSSGGSAVAVQADLCLAALGSDTGGSIRQPAAFCGVYGLKPTYGRVSRYGLLAYASSFDQIGTFTQSIEDAEAIMQIISGIDAMDATTTDVEVAIGKEVPRKPYRIAYIKECIEHEGIDHSVKNATLEAIKKLKNDGHVVEEVSFNLLDYLVPIYYVLTTAEASSNLSRYSGLLYGHRSENAKDLETTFRKSRTEGFGAEVKRRIMLGTFVLSAGYYDAYYTKAQQVRRMVKERTNEIMSSYDFVLSPTTPTVAFKIGEKASNPIAMYLADVFTVHANISGNPAINVPIGKDDKGMPIGIQIMAKNFAEGELLAFSKRI